jgi:hypothetical protein
MIAVLIALFGSSVVLAFASYVQLRARAALEYASTTEAFFQSMDVLVSCEDTPTELLDLLAAMNEALTDKKAAGAMLAYLSRGSRWKDRRSDAAIRLKAALKDLFAKHPDLEAVYHEALVSYFLAITALSPLVGKLARIAMTEDGVEAAAGARRPIAKRLDAGPARPARA